MAEEATIARNVRAHAQTATARETLLRCVSLQRVVHAAAPCPADIKRQTIDWWGLIVDEFYCSCEGAGISFIRAEDWLTHPGSVGRPILAVPHVLNDNGDELPPGQPGTIYFENAMQLEYLGDAARLPAHATTVVGRQLVISATSTHR